MAACCICTERMYFVVGVKLAVAFTVSDLSLDERMDLLLLFALCRLYLGEFRPENSQTSFAKQNGECLFAFLCFPTIKHALNPLGGLIAVGGFFCLFVWLLF